MSNHSADKVSLTNGYTQLATGTHYSMVCVCVVSTHDFDALWTVFRACCTASCVSRDWFFFCHSTLLVKFNELTSGLKRKRGQFPNSTEREKLAIKGKGESFNNSKTFEAADDKKWRDSCCAEQKIRCPFMQHQKNLNLFELRNCIIIIEFDENKQNKIAFVELVQPSEHLMMLIKCVFITNEPILLAADLSLSILLYCFLVVHIVEFWTTKLQRNCDEEASFFIPSIRFVYHYDQKCCVDRTFETKTDKIYQHIYYFSLY